MKKLTILVNLFFLINNLSAQSVLIPGGINNIGESEADEILIKGSNVETDGSQFRVIFQPPENQPDSPSFVRDTEDSKFRFITMSLGNQSFHTNDDYLVKGDVNISSISHDPYGGWSSIFSISDGKKGWNSNYTQIDFYMERLNENGWKVKFYLRFIYKRNGNIIERKNISTLSNFEFSSYHNWEVQFNPEDDPSNWIIKIDGNVEQHEILRNEVNDIIENKLVVDNYLAIGSNNYTQSSFNSNNDFANGNHSVSNLSLDVNGANVLNEDDIWTSPLSTIVSNIEENPPENDPSNPIQALVDCEVSALKNINHIPGSVGWTAFYAKQGAAEKAGVFDGDVAINGDIVTKGVKVTSSNEIWPDYVFDENYDLQDLQQLEQYIKTHKHLPNIPDAQTIKEEGLDLGEMNAKLLEKIEELSLYIIEQDKVNNEQNKENQELKEKIESQQNELDRQRTINKAYEEKFQLLEKRLKKLEN